MNHPNMPEADGALTGREGLNALFQEFQKQDRTKDVVIAVAAGLTRDLAREVLLIRIGDVKFLTTEDQAMTIAKVIVMHASRLSIQAAMMHGSFAGALVSAVEGIQSAKRETRMH